MSLHHVALTDESGRVVRHEAWRWAKMVRPYWIADSIRFLYPEEAAATGWGYRAPANVGSEQGEPPGQYTRTFQTRTRNWVIECFGEEVASDKTERAHRFLEEALELVQAAGCTASEANQLVDYVFGRPVGDLPQEVGATVVTLAMLCSTYGLKMDACGEAELARIWTKVEQIRAKHAAKPKFSPLPGATIPDSAPAPPDLLAAPPPPAASPEGV
jgi:hypothetical protein